MTTSESTCLFHDRQYSSNIQCILNLLRKTTITIKCDLNLLVKISLCTCRLSAKDIQVTNEEFTRQEEEFNQLNEHAWFKEVNQIIQMKIKEICNSKLSLYKLFKFICEISTGKAFLKLTKNRRNEEKKLTHRTPQPTTLYRCIELTLPPSRLGYLLGRNGHLHKQIMSETGTRIHFQNAPYSSNVKPHRCPEFNLDLLQSTSLLKVKITGDTDEAIDNAVHALEQLDRDTQIRLAQGHDSLQK